MRKVYFFFVFFLITLTSCFNKARVRVPSTGAVITTDAYDYSWLKTGDTVQLSKIDLGDWEIEEKQVSFPKDTAYFFEYKSSVGDTVSALCEKRIGIIEEIR